MLHRWRNLCLVSAVAFGCLTASAQTITSSYSSKTISVTITDVEPTNPGTGQWKIHYSWVWTNGGSNGVGSGEIYSGATLRVYQTNASNQGVGSITVPDNQGTVTWKTQVDYYGPQNVQTVVISKPAAPTHKVTVSLTNPTDFPVRYRLMQGSTQLGEITLQPGQSVIQTFTTSSSAPVTVLAFVENLGRDGDGWVVVDGAVTQVPINGTSTANPVPAADNTTPPTSVGPPNVPQGTNPTNTTINQTNNTIWSPGGSPDALTNSVYREGVNKLLASDAKTQADLGKIEQNTRETADEAKEIRKSTDKLGKHLDRLQEIEDANPDNTAVQAERSEAVESEQEEYPNAFTGLGYSVPSGNAPNFEISLPAAWGGGATFDLNPFRSDRFGPLAAALRSAFSWLAIMLLAVWVWRELGEYMRGVAAANQARGNPVVAGTGAQATALLAAGVIATAVISLGTALLAFTFGEFGVKSVITLAQSNPVSAWPAGAVWMIDQVLPIGVLISCFVAKLAFSVYAVPLFSLSAMIIRFTIS